MGSAPDEILDADNIATNVLYQCNDFGTRTPDPAKPFKRYYSIAKSERRKFKPIWKSCRTPSDEFSKSVTYVNWEIHDLANNDDETTKTVGMLYATYYFRFRRPRLDNVNPD